MAAKLEELVSKEAELRRSLMATVESEAMTYITLGGQLEDLGKQLTHLKFDVENIGVEGLEVSGHTALESLTRRIQFLEQVKKFEETQDAFDDAIEAYEIDVAADYVAEGEYLLCRFICPPFSGLPDALSKSCRLRPDLQQLTDETQHLRLRLRSNKAQLRALVDDLMREFWTFAPASVTVRPAVSRDGCTVALDHMWHAVASLGCLAPFLSTLSSRLLSTVIQPVFDLVTSKHLNGSGSVMVLAQEEQGEDNARIWSWRLQRQDTAGSVHEVILTPLLSFVDFLYRHFCFDAATKAIFGGHLWNWLVHRTVHVLPHPTDNLDRELIRSLERLGQTCGFVKASDSRLHDFVDSTELTSWSHRRIRILESVKELIFSEDVTTMDVSDACEKDSYTQCCSSMGAESPTAADLDPSLAHTINPHALDDYLQHENRSGAFSCMSVLPECSVSSSVYKIVKLIREVVEESTDVGRRELDDLSEQMQQTARDMVELFIFTRPKTVDSSSLVAGALFFSDCLYVGYSLNLLAFRHMSETCFVDQVQSLQRLQQTVYSYSVKHKWESLALKLETPLGLMNEFDVEYQNIEKGLADAVGDIRKSVKSCRTLLPSSVFLSTSAFLVDGLCLAIVKKLLAVGKVSSAMSDLQSVSIVLNAAASVLQAATQQLAGKQETPPLSEALREAVVTLLNSLLAQIQPVVDISKDGRSVGEACRHWSTLQLIQQVLEGDLMLFLSEQESIRSKLTRQEFRSLLRLNVNK